VPVNLSLNFENMLARRKNRFVEHRFKNLTSEAIQQLKADAGPVL
jgi:hypothetical protein